VTDVTCRIGPLPPQELEEISIAERRYQAAQILDPPDPSQSDRELSVLEGTLFYKRQNRKSWCHTKGCVQLGDTRAEV
jgi:hypothetical protein